MPSTYIDIILHGVDSAVVGIDRVKTSMVAMGDEAVVAGDKAEASGKKFHGFGLLAAGALALGIKDAVKGGLALSATQAQVQAQLKATGQAGKGAFEEIQKAAENTKHGFDAQQNLGAIKLFLVAHQSVTNAIKDMTTAQNLARTSGMSYASALAYTRTVLAGNTRGIGRYVKGFVPVKTAEQELLTTHLKNAAAWQAEAAARNKAIAGSGTAWLKQIEIANGVTKAMQAQAVATDKAATGRKAIAALGPAVAPAGQAFDNSTAGKVQALDAQIKNLKDSIGLALLPAVKAVVGVLTPMFTWLAKNKVVMDSLIGIAGTLGTIYLAGKLYGGLRDAYKGTKELYDGFKTLGGTIREFGSRALTKLKAGLDFIRTALFADKAATEGLKVAQGEAVVATEAQTVASGQAAVAVDVEAASMDAAAVSAGGFALALGVVALQMIVATGGIVLIALALYEGYKHFNLIKQGAEIAWNWIKGHWPLLAAIMLGPFAVIAVPIVLFWKKIKHAAGDVIKWLKKEWPYIKPILEAPFKLAWGVIKKIVDLIKDAVNWVKAAVQWVENATTKGNPDNKVGRGEKGNPMQNLQGHYASGGPVFGGGPSGTDTIPAWLTPGEGIVTRAGMAHIGELGLSKINTGDSLGQQITLNPGTVETTVNIDGKAVAKAVTHYVLNKAARGPTSLSGGSLATSSVSS